MHCVHTVCCRSEGPVDIYAESVSELNYEPISPNETQVSDEQPQYLEYGDGMQNGSTTKKEGERVVNSSYI